MKVLLTIQILRVCLCSAVGIMTSDELIVAIYSVGASNATYYFNIDTDQSMTVYRGIRTNEDIRSSDFFRHVSETKTIQLSENEYNKIINLVNQFENNVNQKNDSIVYDSWEAKVLYRGVEYTIRHKDIHPLAQELINEIKNLSPVKIWAMGLEYLEP